jgi:uncharacterized protein
LSSYYFKITEENTILKLIFSHQILYPNRSHIDWLAAGFLIGGYIGPSIVRHVSSKVLRVVIAADAMGLAIALFIHTYF